MSKLMTNEKSAHKKLYNNFETKCLAVDNLTQPDSIAMTKT